jgi:Phage tail lysozyme
MSTPDIPALDPSWHGVYQQRQFLADNAPTPELREHFRRELAVMAPTLKALGIDVGQPPPVPVPGNGNGVQASAVVGDAPPGGGQSGGNGAVDPESPDKQHSDAPAQGTDVIHDKKVDGPLSEDKGREMAIAVAKQLQKDLGLTPQQAAGIVGNFWHESAGMNSNVNEFGSDPSRSPYGEPNSTQFGYGWAQWTGTRKDDFLAFCKANKLEPSSPAGNYAFLVYELKNSEAASLGKVRETSSVDEAARAYMLYNERPTNPVYDKRVAAAERLYEFLA